MNHLINRKISRRRVLQIMGWAIFLPVAGLWNSMVKRDQEMKKGSGNRIEISGIPEGVSYYGEYMVVRNELEFHIFSLRCTHLGCVLKVNSSGLLECPCHGSVFNPVDGEPLQGPAGRKLQRPDFRLDLEFLTIF